MRRARSIRAGGWLRPSKFFHSFLTSAEPEEIVAYLGSLKKGAEELQKNLLELVIYSGGAFSWSEVWHMSFSEREMAVKVLNDYSKAKAGKSATEWM
jgi:hypothetical protein